MSAGGELVVCATDFSQGAAGALEWAVGFARRAEGRVDLVHVLPEPTHDREQLAADAVRFEAERLHDARARLEQLAESAARGAGISVHPQILIGHVEERIVEHARGHAARAIVVGPRSRPLVERWALGSVGERTVRSASCPVVVVPHRTGARQWFAAGDPARPLKILVGLEGADGAAELVKFAADLRRKERCDVTFVHFYWPPEEYARLGLRGARNPLEVDVDVVTSLEPKLRPLIDGLPGFGRVALDIEPALGSPASNLTAAAAERPYDMIVVGAHQRHGLARVLKGSVSESLVHHAARVPVVCIPIAAARAGGSQVGNAGLPRVLTVLAPTDLSEVGNTAIPYAYALLRATGGVVELCHVHDHAIPNPAYAYDIPDRLTTAERAAIEERLRALAPAEAESLGITTHVSVIDGGKAAETIVAAAERLNVDAISLGSHGRSGVARAMMGSVAEAVVRHAKHPVLIVPSR